MKFIVLDDYYMREAGSTYAGRYTNTTLCDSWQEAYKKYTDLIEQHTAANDKVRKEQTLRLSFGSYARCEFEGKLITSIQQLDHPNMETIVS